LFFIGYGAHNLELGLDQATAVPKDSYLQPYFEDLVTTLRVGPPAFFVVRPNALTNDLSLPAQQNLLCGINHCDGDSLETTILQQTANPLGYIASGANSWIDDYISWLMSRGRCCRYNQKTGAYCDPTVFDDDCIHCLDENKPGSYNIHAS
jgi:Niemann-Pick C1 protein